MFLLVRVTGSIIILILNMATLYSLCRRIVLKVVINVSDEPIASILRTEDNIKIGNHLQD